MKEVDVQFAKHVLDLLGPSQKLEELNIRGFTAIPGGLRLLVGPPDYLVLIVKRFQSGWEVTVQHPKGLIIKDNWLTTDGMLLKIIHAALKIETTA